MKVILKDKQEIEIARSNINYNTLGNEEEKNTIVFTIDDPIITPENLLTMLTEENLSEVQIISDVKTIIKKDLRNLGISENITDEFYRIDIRLAV